MALVVDLRSALKHSVGFESSKKVGFARGLGVIQFLINNIPLDLHLWIIGRLFQSLGLHETK